MDPLSVLIAATLITICVSALCSLAEAALYAVPITYVQSLAERGSRRSRRLLELKQNIWKPISAILILNTVSNTGGAAIAGWAAAQILPETWALVYSCLLVLFILYLSEILPKTIGVVFCKPVAELVALPITGLIHLFAPLILFSKFLSERVIGSSSKQQQVSHEEVLSLAAIGTEEGSLDLLEGYMPLVIEFYVFKRRTQSWGAYARRSRARDKYSPPEK
jgi:Mg2+/Co2+ transporter CorB